MDRRRFLAGLAGLATAGSALAQSDPDVVIVGAGMAGLAAARTLTADGFRVRVIEARNRIGDRAFTDTTRFSWPFDRGCTWIHSADVNPMTDIASKMGFDTLVDDTDTWLYLDGREATGTEYDRAEEALAALWRAIDRLSVNSDKSVYNAHPPASPFDRMAHDLLRAGHAVDTRRLSAVDANSQIGTGIDRRVPRGFGALVAAYGRDVPVTLGTPVQRIRLTPSGVAVDTTSGTIPARAAIVTVPVSILQEDRIAFDPPLPAWKRAAIDGMAMGLLNKVAIPMAPGFLPQEGVTCIVRPRGGTTIELSLGAFGRPVAVGFLGGRLADELEAAGPDAARAHVLDALADVLGSEARSAARDGVVTEWRRDPFSRGAYSAALPGFAAARADLARPVDDRLFFGGEACHTKWATQVPGALLSGQRAAKQVQAL